MGCFGDQVIPWRADALEERNLAQTVKMINFIGLEW